MQIDLTGKTALVCGASHGVGRECARQLVSQGGRVILMGRDEKSLQSIIESFEAHHPVGHRYIALDQSDRKTLHTQVKQELEANGPVSIWVNHSNRIPLPMPILKASDKDYDIEFEHYLHTSQDLARLLIPGMQEQQFGRVVNIVPISAIAQLDQMGVAQVARAAVMSWAKSLALEVVHNGITVNNVLAGIAEDHHLEYRLAEFAKKQKMPVEKLKAIWQADLVMGRFAQPDEIASAVTFLASSAASYVNGVNLTVDGGQSLSWTMR